MKIALTLTDTSKKHLYYQQWLKADDDIDMVTLSASDNNLTDLDACDALVLSGGRDIHPKFYGSDNLAYPGAPKGYDERRDDFEMSAFRQAQNINLPVLGICRGLQLINVVCKGDLVQNIDDQDGKQSHIGNSDKLHQVTIQAGTLLYDIIGEKTGDINSAHHQAIHRLGEGLLINSWADDGTIEGVEWKEKTGKPFMLAVQWHPERMFRFQLEKTPLSKNIRDRFVMEIIKMKN